MQNGFRFVKADYGQTPTIEEWLMDDSSTLQEGEAVKLKPDVDEGSVIRVAATTDTIYGICVGFQTRNRLPLETDSSSYGSGTLTKSPVGDTFVSDSDNVSTEKVRALVIPIMGATFSALLDAAKGTTDGSDRVGVYLSISTSDPSKLLENSVTTTFTVGTNGAQFVTVPGMAPDNATDPTTPESTTRILVRCVAPAEVLS
jgi:hypothetical protein